MREIGCYWIDDYEENSIYSDDFVHFFDKEMQEIKREEMEKYAIILNSPWSDIEMKYETKENKCDGAKWKTEYSVIGYDCITASICGYGNTPQESMDDCVKHFEYIQKTYNPKNIRF